MSWPERVRRLRQGRVDPGEGTARLKAASAPAIASMRARKEIAATRITAAKILEHRDADRR